MSVNWRPMFGTSPHSFRIKNVSTLLGGAFFLLFSGFSLMGANDSASFYQLSVAQQSLEQQVGGLERELAKLIVEMRRNSMESPELQTIQTNLNILKTVREQRMAKVAENLKAAAATGNADALQKASDAALADMQYISMELRSLSERIATTRNVQEIVARVENLLVRQRANLAISRRPSLAVESSTLAIKEQTALKDGFEETYRMGVDLVKEAQLADSPLAAMLKVAAATDVAGAANQAAEAISRNLQQSLPAQTRFASGLGNMLDIFKRNLGVTENAKQTEERLKNLVEEQKSLADSEAAPEEKAARQEELSAEVEALARDLRRMDASTTEPLMAAHELMKEAARSFEKDSGEAPKLAQAAAEALEEIRKGMQEQFDRNAEGLTARDTAEALRELFQEAAELSSEHRKSMENPAAADLDALADKAAALQRDAQPIAPNAADALADAHDQIKPNPEAARKHLDQAMAEIGQQLNRMDQMARRDEAMTNAEAALAEAQEALGEGMAALEENAAEPAQAAEAMQAASAEAAQAAAEAAPLSPQTAEAAKGAAAQAAESGNQAQKGDAEAAQAAAQQASAQLQEAGAQLAANREALQQQMARHFASATPQQPAPGMENQNMQGQLQESGMPSTGDHTTTLDHTIAGSGVAAAEQFFTGELQPHEREALNLFRNENAPAQFSSETDNYMRNLAEGTIQ